MNIYDQPQAVLQTYAGAVKTNVLKRDTDLLTKDEETKNWKLVQAAMLEELQIWVKYECFRIELRKDAYNVMYSRNVLK